MTGRPAETSGAAAPAEASNAGDVKATAAGATTQARTGQAAAADRLEDFELDGLVADLQPSIERFGRQAAMLESANRRFPCVWMDGKVPHPTVVDLEACFMAMGFSALMASSNVLSRDDVLDGLEKAMRSSRLQLTTAHVDDARHYFRARLLAYVSARLNGTAPNAPLGTVAPVTSATAASPLAMPSNALPFRVFSETKGTRVHVSPAYFYDPARVFAAPTSPAVGFLQPGTYIFGVARRDGVWFDPAEFEVPGHVEAHLIY